MLNQEKTGKFMAEMRRNKKLTQKQMAEMIGVSDKTISKWETGRSLPDNTIIMDVCLLLDISVNELLSGEKFSEEHYIGKAEETMLELVKETEYHKKKGKWNMLGTICSFLLLLLRCMFTVLGAVGVENMSWFLDMPSIIIPFGITAFVLFASESLWDFVQGFGVAYGKKEVSKEQMQKSWMAMKTVLVTIPVAGAFAFIVRIVAVMGHLSLLENLGPLFAVACLSIFYCCIAEILLIPTAVRIRKRCLA